MTHTSTQVLLLQYYILHTTRGSSVGARVGGGQIAGSQSGSWEERQFVSWIKQTGWIRANCVMLFRLCGDSGIGLSRATLADNVMSWRITRYFTLKLSDVVVNLKSKISLMHIISGWCGEKMRLRNADVMPFNLRNRPEPERDKQVEQTHKQH